MNGRAGKQARRLANYRLALRSTTEAAGESVSDTPPGRATMQRSAFYGSKCYKTPADRRPSHGGKVHS